MWGRLDLGAWSAFELFFELVFDLVFDFVFANFMPSDRTAKPTVSQ
jgi:hypothetical protein